MTAAFDYGDFVCLFSTGADNIPRYDTYLEVYGKKRVVRVDYDTPFVRNLPITLSITESSRWRENDRVGDAPGLGATPSLKSGAPSTIASSAASRPKRPRKTFRQDLLLYREMIQHMAQEAGRAQPH